MTEDLNRGAGDQIETDTLTAETVADDVAGGAESATLVGQAVIPVDPPAAGQTVTLQPQPGDRFQLNANASDVRIQIEGVNVVLAFDTNGDGAPDSRVVFERLVEVAAQQNPPVIVVGGQAIAANVLIGGALALAGEEATVETAADAGAEGTGGTVYDDDLGNLIALLIAQGIIPPTELAFGLLDRIEIVQFDLNEAEPLEPCDCDEKLLKYLETWRDGEFAGVLSPLEKFPGEGAFDKVENGTAGNDKLFGGIGSGFPIDSMDLLRGGKGDDLIRGLSGDDWLFGQEGKDLIYGDGLFGIALPSKDSLIALKGGGEPKESLFGGKGELELAQILLHGDDIIFGGDGENELIGGGGEDWLIGGGDDDVIVGDTWPTFGHAVDVAKDTYFGEPREVPVEQTTLRQETLVNGSGGGTGGFLGGFFEDYLNGKQAFMFAVDGMTDYNDILEGGGADGGEGGDDILVGDALLTPGVFDGGEGGSGCTPNEIALFAIGGLVGGGEGGFAPVDAYNDLLRVDKNDEDSENTLVGDAYLYGKESRYDSTIDLFAVSGGEGEVHAFNDVFCGGDGEDLIVGDAYLEGEGEINLTAAVKDSGFGGSGQPTFDQLAYVPDNYDYTFVAFAQIDAFNDYIQGAGGDDEMIGDAYLEGEGDINLSVAIPKDTTIGALSGEATYLFNEISAFNDEMCPCGDTGNDLLVGDAYLEGEGDINLSVGLPPLKDQYVGAPTMTTAAIQEIPVDKGPDFQINLFGNKVSAFNDCLDGGPETVPVKGGIYDFDGLVGDAYLEGEGNVNLSVGLPLLQDQKVALFDGGEGGGVDWTIAKNQVEAFNDQLFGGAEGDWLVGDVAVENFDNEDEVEASIAVDLTAGEGDAVFGNKISAYNDFIDGGSDDWSDDLVGDVSYLIYNDDDCYSSGEVDLSANLSAFGGGVVGGEGGPVLLALDGGEGGDYCEEESLGNTVSVFNDTLLGGNGYDELIGDVDYEVYNYNSDGQADNEVNLSTLLEAGFGGTVAENEVTAYSDTLVGGGEGDWMVGDVAVYSYSYDDGYTDNDVNLATVLAASNRAWVLDNEVFSYNDSLEGGTGSDDLTGDVAYYNSTGSCDDHDVYLEASLGAEGGWVNDNLVESFNDFLDGGDGQDRLVGDVRFTDSGYDNDSNVELDASMTASFDGLVGEFDPLLYLPLLEGGEGGEVCPPDQVGNELYAYNDELIGGEGYDWLVGDVWTSNANVHLNAGLSAFFGGKVLNNYVEAYSDTLSGGEDDDLLVGDVFSDGKYQDGQTDICLSAELEAWGGGQVGALEELFFITKTEGSDPRTATGGNEVNVYNDSLDGGEGHDDLVGDVFFINKHNEYDSGRVALYTALSAVDCDSIVAGNLLDAYNDSLTGGDGEDRLVGDVWYSGDGGEGSDVEIDVSVTANDGGLVFDNEVTAHKDSLAGGADDDLLVGDVYRDVDWGYGKVDLGVEVGIDADNWSDESEVSYNTVDAFNDLLIGDGGDDLLVGDVYYTSWDAGKGAPGAVHLSLDHGIDNFSWGKGKFQDGQTVTYNTVNAYNDKLVGGAGDDDLVGDVFYQAELGVLGGVDIDLANGINIGYGGGEGDHEFKHNTTTAFNDSLYGDGDGILDSDPSGGSDLLVGDVYYLLEGGKSAPAPMVLPLVQEADGTVEIDVLNGINVHNDDPNWNGNQADDNDHEHNTLTAFNDVIHGDSLDGGEGGGEALVLPGGDDTLIGDVYYHIDGGEGGVVTVGTVDIDVHTGINVGADDTGGSGNEFKDNTTTVFSDQIFGGGGEDLLVGDVYYQIEGGEGGGGGGTVDIEVLDGIDLENGSQGDSNEHQRNTLVAFNDEMEGGDGDDRLVGDVRYDTGQATIGSVHLLVETGAASRDSGVYGDKAAEDGNGNEVYAFNDSLDGGEGHDDLVGDVEAHGFTDDIVLDAMFVGGGSGNLLSAFNDLLYGDGGNDQMVGDVWHQGKGTTIDLFAGTIEEGHGSSTVEAYNDELYGGDGEDNLAGDVRVASIFGGTVDLLAEAAGGSSHDVLAFNDKMLGGGGHDALVGDVWLDGESVSANLSAEAQDNTQGDDNKTLDAFNDHMEGGDGDDTLVGDVLVDRSGTLSTVDLTARVLDHDKHRVRAFNDYLAGGIGADALIGDLYGLGANGTTVNLLADMDSGDNADDNNGIVAFNDTITGSAGEDDLAGDVWMDATDVSITLRSETGADGDINSVNAFSDTLDGGTENDELVGDVRSNGSNATIALEVEHYDGHADDNTTGIFNDHIAGGDGDDTLVGDVWIEGEGGTGNSVAFLLDMVDNSNASGQIIDAYNDLLTGGKGNDVLVGDVWFEGDGSVDITFDIGNVAGDDGTLEAFNDTLEGGDGDDDLYGDFFDGDGNFLPVIVHTGDDASGGAVFSDTLDGGAGTDLLSGGIGDDTLTGGTESDTFFWFAGDLTEVNDLIDGGGVNGGGDFSIDVVTDFSSTIDADLSPAEAGVNDVIDLADLLAGLGVDASDLFLSTNGTDSFIHIDQGGGGGDAGDQVFINLTGFNGTDVTIQDLIDNGNLQAV